MKRPALLFLCLFVVPFTAVQSQTDAVHSAFVSPAAPSPDPGTLFWYPERVPIGDGGTLLDAERGIMFVPLKRSDPETGVIGVEVYRFRGSSSTDPNTPPPVFLLHGGPGWPGLEPSLRNESYYERAIQPFRDVADLVVLGQRGIGSSKPNTICAPGNRLSPDCRSYWESANLDLHGFTVVEAAAEPATLMDSVSAVEHELYQVRNQSPKDKIAFPIKLNDRLTGLRSHLERGDNAPTAAYYQVYEELSAKLSMHLSALERALREYLPQLNAELEREGLPPIRIPDTATHLTS